MKSRIRVLHVDDDPGIADLVKTFLKRVDEQFEIETAMNVDEGLARFEADQYDCIVSDYDMPGQNGIQFLETIRDTHPDQPFILYTGKGSEAVASDAISAGVTDYLQKEGGTDHYNVLANRITNAVQHSRSQKEVERGKRRFRDVIDNLPHHLYVVDKDGTFLLANEELAEFHDSSADDIEGSDVAELLEAPVADAFRAHIEAVLDEGVAKRFDTFEITGPSGNTRIFERRLRPYEFGETDTPAVLGIAADVTEQKDRAQEMRNLKEEYEMVFEAAQDAIFMWNVDHTGSAYEFRLQRLNPAHEAISDLATEEDHGKTPDELLGEEMGEEVTENLRRCVEAEKPITYEETLEMPSGTVHWETKLGPVVRDGEVTQIVGVARDITDQK